MSLGGNVKRTAHQPPARLGPLTSEQRLGLLVAAYGLLLAGMPHITVVPRPIADVLFSSIAVALGAFVVFEAATLPMPHRWHWPAFAAAALGLWGFTFVGLWLTHGFSISRMVFNVSQLLFAAALGATIAGLLREAKLIPPIAVTLALIDWVGVNYGIVAQWLARRPDIVAHMAQAIPVAGSAAGAPAAAPQILMTVGLGDWVFMAFFFAAAARFELNRRATLYAILTLALVGLGVVLAAGVDLPGLPLIGGAAILCNLKHFRYTRQEQFALLYGALFLAALAAAYYFGSVRLLSGEEVPTP